jgi:hypothetical protein
MKLTLARLVFAIMLALACCVAVAEDQVLEEDGIAILHRSEDAAAARDAMDTMHGLVGRLSGRVSLGSEPVRVILCGDMAIFRRHAGPYGLPNIGGLARPAEGLIILKTPGLLPPGTDYAGVARHELVHILLERNTDTDVLPGWFNEGLAMHLSGEYRWESLWRVGEMLFTGSVIPYRELNLVLASPGIEMEFGDAYAQSLSMTRYLFRLMGDDGVWNLLGDLDEMSFGDAMRKHLGMSPPAFYDAWKRSLWVIAIGTSLVSGFSLFQAMAFLSIWAWFRLRRRNERIMRKWDREERGVTALGPMWSDDEREAWEDEYLDDDEDDDE